MYIEITNNSQLAVINTSRRKGREEKGKVEKEKERKVRHFVHSTA